jgi:hypothetical protein
VGADSPRERTTRLAVNIPPPRSTPIPAKSAIIIHSKDFELEEFPCDGGADKTSSQVDRFFDQFIVWQNVALQRKENRPLVL